MRTKEILIEICKILLFPKGYTEHPGDNMLLLEGVRCILIHL